ncbi:MAG: DUF4124 domain-containing protein [Comamonadaceae bacterium]|nr:DUF4124 domain-containing protein [Comamonadaceae bacterium]
MLAAAQKPIYQSTDKAGTVFSDTPTPWGHAGRSAADQCDPDAEGRPIRPATASAGGRLWATADHVAGQWRHVLGQFGQSPGSGVPSAAVELHPGRHLAAAGQWQPLPRSFTSNTISVTQVISTWPQTPTISSKPCRWPWSTPPARS